MIKVELPSGCDRLADLLIGRVLMPDPVDPTRLQEGTDARFFETMGSEKEKSGATPAIPPHKKSYTV